MSSVIDRISNALSALGKRKEPEADPIHEHERTALQPPSKQPAVQFRPWDQNDIVRRLRTYRPLTWFAKPASVGAVECASKGWFNESRDMLCCEICGNKLLWPQNVPYETRDKAAALFQAQLASSHGNHCPWKQTKCDEKVLAFIPHEALGDQFLRRQSSLSEQVDMLPDIDEQALHDVVRLNRPILDRILDRFQPTSDSQLAVAAPRTTTTTHPLQPSVTIEELGTTPGPAAAGMDVDASASAPAGIASISGIPSPSAPLRAPAPSRPSKLTTAQKAKVLALLGWDTEVLPAEASHQVQSLKGASSYSLQHLLGCSSTAGKAGSSSSSASGKTSMASIVLTCPVCQSRVGLWNFADVKPVPVGRFTVAPESGASAMVPYSAAKAALHSGATPGSGATAGAAAMASMPEALSRTIAGGSYSHGYSAAAVGATPFRFGSSSAQQTPVFGLAALEPSAAQPAAVAAAATPAPSTRQPAAPASAIGSKRPAERPAEGDEDMAVAAAGGDAAAAAASPAPSGRASSWWSVLQHSAKRARGGAASAGASTPAGGSTPAPATTPRPAAAVPGVGGAPASPGAVPWSPSFRPPGSLVGSEGPQLLDPVRQHRSWCPWVYTGGVQADGNPRLKCGVNHLLSTLDPAQPQEAVAAAAAVSPGGGSSSISSGRSIEEIKKRLQDSLQKI